MTETEKNALRVKVNKSLGWTEVSDDFDWGWQRCGRQNDGPRIPVPDYPNDLNACAEFEKDMTGDQCERYNEALVEVTWHEAGLPVKCQAEHFPWFYTATQRCRAFVATMEEKQ